MVALRPIGSRLVPLKPDTTPENSERINFHQPRIMFPYGSVFRLVVSLVPLDTIPKRGINI